ncbi:hypothetical protein BH11PLA2_BH11PLA2_42950 [soil metagenome]
MTRLRALLLITFAWATLAPLQAAFITIDNFSNPAAAQFVLIGPNPNPTTTSGSPTGLGSTRTGTFSVVSPLPANPLDLTVQLGSGSYIHNSSNFAVTHGSLVYSAFTGGTGNFSASGIPLEFIVRFASVDPGFDLSTGLSALNMPLDVVIATSTGSLSGTFFVPSSPNIPIAYQIPFASLTAAGLVDLSQVNTVTLNFNNGVNNRQAADFAVTGFDLVTTPVPPAVFIGLAAIPVLGLLRRFRKA